MMIGQNMKLGATMFAIILGVATTTTAHDRSFASLDADGNGSLTLSEMQAAASARFNEMDANDDGVLSQDELAAQGRERRAERMIERLDENGDDALSAEELMSRRDPARFFERADKDSDGALSQEEFEEAGKKMRGKRHRN